MGLFDFFRNQSATKTNEAISQIPWKVLSTWDQLDEIEKTSHHKAVVIFKHSTRCGVSRMVLRNFENSLETPEGDLDFYYLDLLAHRDLSDEIAIRFQVIHQSPQILVIKNGQTIHHASHHAVRAENLRSFVN